MFGITDKEDMKYPLHEELSKGRKISKFREIWEIQRWIYRKGIRGIGILQDNFQYFFIDFYGSFMYDSIAKYGMPKCGDLSIAAVIPKQYYERGYTYYGKS